MGLDDSERQEPIDLIEHSIDWNASDDEIAARIEDLIVEYRQLTIENPPTYQDACYEVGDIIGGLIKNVKISDVSTKLGQLYLELHDLRISVFAEKLMARLGINTMVSDPIDLDTQKKIAQSVSQKLERIGINWALTSVPRIKEKFEQFVEENIKTPIPDFQTFLTLKKEMLIILDQLQNMRLKRWKSLSFQDHDALDDTHNGLYEHILRLAEELIWIHMPQK